MYRSVLEKVKGKGDFMNTILTNGPKFTGTINFVNKKGEIKETISTDVVAGIQDNSGVLKMMPGKTLIGLKNGLFCSTNTPVSEVIAAYEKVKTNNEAVTIEAVKSLL